MLGDGGIVAKSKVKSVCAHVGFLDFFFFDKRSANAISNVERLRDA